MSAADTPETPRPATVIGPEEGRVLEVGPARITLKVTAQETDQFSLVDYRVGPRFTAPPQLHYNEREDWAAVILEGTITYVFADREVTAPAGSTVLIPRGTAFAWRNDADEPARYLAIYAPAGFEQFFVDVAQGINAAGGFSPEVMAEVIPPLWSSYGVYPSGAGPAA